MRRILLAGCAVLLLSISGCGLSIPADPDGTLDEVRGGTLRVGISDNGELTTVGDGKDVSGSEVAAVEEFASELDADIDWTLGSEEALVRSLENGDLDLVIAGLTDATPWAEHAGMTRPYDEVTGSDGTTHKLVMLVPTGENAFLSELETFLAEYTGEVAR
jgi:ABC-type amino acid transport substrate-binding protein